MLKINNQPDISVVVPVLNEDETLLELHTRISKALKQCCSSYQIIYVDDGSKQSFKDKLCKLANEDAFIKLVFLSRNFGKECALSAGLKAVTGTCAVVIDGDLQDPPELIPQMYQEFRSGNEVIAMRRRDRAGETYFKRVCAHGFYRLLNKISPVEIPVDTGDFRLMGRKTVDAINELSENNRYMKGLFAWVGMTTKVIEYDRDARYAGDSKWGFIKLLGLSVEAITSFSISPLRIATISGIFACLAAIAFGLWIAIEKIILGNPLDGYPSTILLITFLGGVQLLSIGLLGEYIGKIYMETKRRPLFIIEEEREGGQADENVRPFRTISKV